MAFKMNKGAFNFGKGTNSPTPKMHNAPQNMGSAYDKNSTYNKNYGTPQKKMHGSTYNMNHGSPTDMYGTHQKMSHSPTDMKHSPTNMGSPQKILPALVYGGLSLAARYGARKALQYGARKLTQRSISKLATKAGQQGLAVIPKGAKNLQKVSNFLGGGKTYVGKTIAGFATFSAPGIFKGAKNLITGGKKKPEVFDPKKGKGKGSSNNSYTKAKKKDPNLDKFIKIRNANKKGSDAYNAAQNRINLAYGVSKRHGVKTTADASGRKIRSTKYVPGISKQETATNKRRNKTVTKKQSLITGDSVRTKTKANKTKQTVRTSDTITKTKVKRGKTITRTRKRGQIFGTRKRT